MGITRLVRRGEGRGFLLVGILFTTLALLIGSLASVTSMQISNRAIVNKLLVMHAHMGAESAIEAGIHTLNTSISLTALSASVTLPLRGSADCDDLTTPAAQNAAPLSWGSYVVDDISQSSAIADVYQVNWAVNIDLSASSLLSPSQWLSDSTKLTLNQGYPQADTANSYAASTTAIGYMPKCLERTSQRLLRAEANVVPLSDTSHQPAITRRVAAIVVVDPLCADTTSGVPPFGGCKTEVVHWYEE